MMTAIVYRATVEGVSGVDLTLKVLPAKDGEEPLTPTDGFGNTRINVPGSACGEDVVAVIRAFGALMYLEGAVRITIESDPLSPACVDPDIRISCRMCLDEHESFIPMDRAKGKAPCPRCNQNLADVIVLDELSTKTGFRTCLHARGQGTADMCVEPEGHPGMHSNGSGGFWAKACLSG